MDDLMDETTLWAAGNMTAGDFFEAGSEALARAHAEETPGVRSVLFGLTPGSGWTPRAQFSGGEWGPRPEELHLDVPRLTAVAKPSRARKSTRAAR